MYVLTKWEGWTENIWLEVLAILIAFRTMIMAQFFTRVSLQGGDVGCTCFPPGGVMWDARRTFLGPKLI